MLKTQNDILFSRMATTLDFDFVSVAKIDFTREGCSEVWNRVYMIAPVKKFGLVRLSTIFL